MLSHMKSSYYNQEYARMVSLIRSLNFHVGYSRMNKEEEFGIVK